MKGIQQKTIGELENPVDALKEIFNGYSIGEIKAGIDALVEFGRIKKMTKKYKLLFIIPTLLFAMWFFGWDFETIVKLLK
ncbi:MAG: hypothetical protein IPM32_14345 [Ignavibacteriae bacterium]|nr:hypothetical protein [Ignavibacteriota bacterium]